MGGKRPGGYGAPREFGDRPQRHGAPREGRSFDKRPGGPAKRFAKPAAPRRG
ncbi:ATP-dependent RNA helicase [Bordetella pertussis]|nr:ATP-dependent RNA helicase [Bordetella pertussis]